MQNNEIPPLPLQFMFGFENIDEEEKSTCCLFWTSHGERVKQEYIWK